MFSVAIALVAVRILDVLIRAESADLARASLGIVAVLLVAAISVAAFVRAGASLR